MVDRRHPSLSIVRQCRLLDIGSSGLYYQPIGIAAGDLALMKLIDRQYLATPFYGARKIAAWLKSQGHRVNRKRVWSLMRIMGLKAIYRHPGTSKPVLGHKTYPFLLSGIKIARSNQVWKVGFSLGFIANSGMDSLVLPNLLEEESRNLAQLVNGFVCGRYNSQGWAWVDKVNMTGWIPSQIGQFLAYLPFNEETWKRSKKLLGKFEEAYWSKAIVNPYQIDSEIYIAVDKLIEYGRPNAAINCLYKVLDEKQPLDKKRTIQALLSAASSKEPSYTMDIYYIIEMIKHLQDDPDTNPDDLLGVEWINMYPKAF